MQSSRCPEISAGVDGETEGPLASTRIAELNDPVIVTDTCFKPPGPAIVEVNEACTSACGRSRANLQGQPLATLYKGLRLGSELAELESCWRARRTWTRQNTLETADGNTVTVSWQITPVENEGEDRLICVIAADGESSVSAEALQASERRFRNLFEHGLIGKAIVMPDGCFSDVNQSYCNLVGYTREELTGAHVSLVLQESDRTPVLDRIGRIFNGGDPGYQAEREYLHKMGHTVTALLDVVPDTDMHGAVQALLLQAQDISEWKSTESGLRESEGRLRDFAEIAADWFWETDENLIINYVSSAHRQITGIPDDKIIGRTREELFRAGIYKAVNPALHLRTLNNYWDSMIEYSVTREDGNEITVHDRASPFFDNQGEFRGYRGVGRDISEQKRLTRRIAWQATRDPLTGCVNRREFERCLEEAVEEAATGEREHVLCFCDLDRFKLLNDTLGHPAGDYLLKQIVQMLQSSISSTDLLGRMGGDEFGLLLRDNTVDKVKKLALEMTKTIQTHEFKWEDRPFNIAMSMGLVPVNEQVVSSSEVLARADTACYRAKEESDSRVWVSDEREAARLRTYTETLRSLSGGPVNLAENFKLVGQPIRPLSGAPDSPPWYEVLLRLVGDDGRFYRPYDFIRLAEQYGKMPMIERWIIQSAVASHAELVKNVPGAVLSINLAGTSLADERLQELMSGLMAKYPSIEPANLCFEIRERTALTDFQRTITLVKSLSEQGYRIALDEFGSGPSSFACLKHLPVQYLKLYGDLVRKLHEHEADIAIVESINNLSDRLNLTLVAVQVETRRAADTLKRIGVEFGQGDALASTQSLDELVAGLKEESGE